MHLEGQYGSRREIPRGMTRRPRARYDAGYAMAALLVAIAIMGVGWATLVPVWKHAVQREKEEELIFRAGQYARAIARYQRRYANAFPPNIDVLLKEKYLRKRYKDPITGGDFRVLSSLELQTAGGFSTRPGIPEGAQTRPGLPSAGAPPTGGAGFGASGSGFSQPGTGGLRQPGQPTLPGSAGREVTANVAAVVSRSTATSIKVFKNRQQYNQWIVTVEDVTPRRGLQPVQPGQQPGRPGFPSQPGQRPGLSPGVGGSGSPGSGIRPPD